MKDSRISYSFFILINFFSIIFSSNDFLRGLNPASREHYNPSSNFKCLDGSKAIPFDRVNDDYCDCNDGSDEPGTAACPNGVFYCLNEGYKPTILPSNRVADGVCDCCDGSDEYMYDVQCENKCLELGAQLRQEEEKRYEMFLAGNEIYKKYSLEGTAAKQEQKEKLDVLQVEKEKVIGEKENQDAIVKNLEGPEEEAKEKFKKEWEVQRDQRREERRRNKAIELFRQLDIDSDGRVSLQELKQKPELDTNADGEVSHEESVDHMAGNEESVDFALFYERVWERMDLVLKSRLKETSHQEATVTQPSEEDDERENEEEGRKEEEEEEGEEEDVDADREGDENEEEGKEKESRAGSDEEEEEEQMPPYDEQTQKFIDAADEARSVAREIEGRLSNLNNDIDQAIKIIDSDYGTSNEFYSLHDQCFELADREYLYKLCPFDRSTQRNKHGGAETSLGYWTRWENSNYSIMLYEKGQGCWNGPDRSTRVSIECGPENKLLSASEPSRCEYLFVLSTPAACKEVPRRETTPREDL